MSAPQLTDSEAVRRQIVGHLQSLRAAGVEWLPVGPPVAWATAEPPAETAPALKGTLFVEPAPLSIAAPAPLEQRRQELKLLAEEVRKCTRCPELASTRTQTVFGQGEPGVELCFVGEAPGGDEDKQGLPFVGAAGQLLNRIIAACGLKREEVYICNILKCRPPGNRTPLPPECANCRPFLERQIELVKPKFICALGGCAATNLLCTTSSLGKLRGRLHDYKGIPVLVTYHPSFLLPHRQPEKKRDVWEDMKFLLGKMGRAVPGK